ncbi:DnaD domain-containing protein [Furfurilactobacillus entadae]|uniref:DnaD domain-containing protein n=1 Tax=Furfurilactobacillus entadae TaxID=2922307 RepID=UPI0035EE5C00
MNYINQINTFFRIAGSAELTAPSRMLYFALLHKNNTLGWIESFTCTADEIKGLSGLSQSAFQRSRKQLIEKSFLKYKSRGSSRAPRYQIMELTDEVVLSILNNTPNNKTDNTSVNTTDNTSNNKTDTLTKQDQTKPNGFELDDDDSNKLKNDTGAREETFNQIEKEFGRPLSPIEMQTIARWFDEDHFKPEIVQVALREATLNQAYSLKYMDTVLVNWAGKNLTSLPQIEQELEKRRQAKVPQTRKAPVTGPTIPLFRVSDPHSAEI